MVRIGFTMMTEQAGHQGPVEPVVGPGLAGFVPGSVSATTDR
ncbi:hypothetical protein ACIGBH_25825 [Streptomyces sp. NPDC085929]